MCILAFSKWKLIYFINTQHFDNFILLIYILHYKLQCRPLLNGASNVGYIADTGEFNSEGDWKVPSETVGLITSKTVVEANHPLGTVATQ